MKQYFTLVLVLLLLAGCATISANKRNKALEETTMLYEKSIRWGDYATARRIQQLAPDTQNTNASHRVRVAGYHRIRSRPLTDENEMGITVQIDYYHNDTLKLIKLTDEQVWKYTPGENSWHITTPLPAFRQ